MSQGTQMAQINACDRLGATGHDNWNRARQLHQDRNDAGALGQDRIRFKFHKVRGC